MKGHGVAAAEGPAKGPGWVQIFSAAEEKLNLIGMWICTGLMFLTVADVFSRYVLNYPLMGIVEVSELLVAPLIMFSVAQTQKLEGHVGMSLLIDRLKGRSYHLVKSLILLISLFIMVIITAYTFQNSLFSLETGENTPILLFPLWPSKLCIPVGGLFLCVRVAIQLIHHLERLSTAKEGN